MSKMSQKGHQNAEGHAPLFPDMYNMMEKSMRLLKFNFVQHLPLIENFKAHLKKKLGHICLLKFG